MFTLSLVLSPSFCPTVSPVIVQLVQQSLSRVDATWPVAGQVAVPQMIRA